MVAVPLDSGDDSAAILPAANAAERTLARVERARSRDPRHAETQVSDSARVPIRLDSDEDGPRIDLSSSVFEFPEAKPRPEEPIDPAEEGTLLDLTGLEQRALAERDQQLSRTSVDDDDPPAPNNRGQVGAIRKVLVECGLCGFHVQIPVEFFGKAIHCPSCAGNSIFTESTLDPIKDEILDRLAAETAERAAIYRGEPEGVSLLRELAGSSAIKSFLVGVGLGVFVLVAMWGALRYRRAKARERIVIQAEEEGWRYARNKGEGAFHEPWCRALDSHRPTERITATELEQGDYNLHPCD